MQVNTSRQGSVTVVKPIGPIIVSELDELQYSLDNLKTNLARRIIIDMTECQFIDSAGLELLCNYRREFASQGLTIKLSGLTEMTEKIFELTRLIQRFQFFSDTSTAIRSFL